MLKIKEESFITYYNQALFQEEKHFIILIFLY